MEEYSFGRLTLDYQIKPFECNEEAFKVNCRHPRGHCHVWLYLPEIKICDQIELIKKGFINLMTPSSGKLLKHFFYCPLAVSYKRRHQSSNKTFQVPPRAIIIYLIAAITEGFEREILACQELFFVAVVIIWLLAWDILSEVQIYQHCNIKWSDGQHALCHVLSPPVCCCSCCLCLT